MQSGEVQNASPHQMTASTPLIETPLSSVSPPVSSPSVASSPPLTAEVSKADITSLSDLRSHGTSIKLPGALSKDISLSQQQQAILAKKIRLGKILSREAYLQSTSPRSNLSPFDDEDSRGDIRVLSPSLVNSQVLPKTRPLSPEPLSPLRRDFSNENHNNAKMGWKEAGGRRKQEAGAKVGRGGKEDQEVIRKDEEKDHNKSGKGMGRRRPRIFKLKFHHQALPPEYLDHYEASLRQEQRHSVPPTDGFRETRAGPRETISEGLQSGLRQNSKNRSGRNQRSSRPITIHEAGGAAATEALLRDLLLASPHLQQAALQQAAIARAQSVPSIMLASVAHNPRMSFPNGALKVPSPDGNLMADDRSSYASDMSIDDSPKRGRKPRKGLDPAYMLGRGLGGIGLGNSRGELEAEKSPSQKAVTEDSAEALSRSRSFTSLLYAAPFDQNEPLNLCVRDEFPRGGDFPLTPPCDTNECEVSRVKREPLTEDENKGSSDTSDHHRGAHAPGDPHTPCSPSDYPAWGLGCNYFGGAPHWIHDYRLKTEDGLSSGQSTPSLCSQSSHLPCMSPPTWPHLSPPPQMPSPHPMSPAPPLSPLMHSNHPRQLQALIKESLQQRFEEAARERLSPRESFGSRRSDRGSPLIPGSRDSPVKSGARRKRSALFIPPADPSTEVSICKFKFTGGANPMLEEKKMVSVDAGGTLRYFSGGDRAAGKNHSNSPNLRLSGKLLENLSKCENDVKKIRLESDTDDTCSLPGGKLEASCSSATASPTGTLEYGVQSSLSLPSPLEDSPKRKRRSKKSSVREKLEQTLREKGLLIQTQQVESAEGATYCKFRQLRKITRYLFRSWKDYLPGQMHEGVPVDHNLHNPRSPTYDPPDLHGTPINSREYASSGH